MMLTSEFHILFWVGSGWVTTCGSGQETWTYAQLCHHRPYTPQLFCAQIFKTVT